MDIILSILVISHNQKELLRRCVTSLLHQKISVSYEIIISDDRSSDGTWDLIEEYMKKYPNLIRGFHCNSDECNPANTSERCGWNKANAYRHSQGKYFVNIDADDYLIDDSIYQKQIDLLECHPECSMCQHQVWVLKDGDPIEKGEKWPADIEITDGQILTIDDVITKGERGLNQSYMMRRMDEINPISIYGKHFDDTIITLHHLQFGNVIVLKQVGYVWVQYANSINNSLKNDDKFVVLSLLPLHHILLINNFVLPFLKEGISSFVPLIKRIQKKDIVLTSATINFLSEFDGFIYKCLLQKEINTISKFHLFCLKSICICINKYHYAYTFLYKIMFILMVDFKSFKKISNTKWGKN